jgi:hypothetical protein
MKKKQQDLISGTGDRVLTLTKERIPFAKLDKISDEIGKSFLNTPDAGFQINREIMAGNKKSRA